MSDAEDFDSLNIFSCSDKVARPAGFDATFLHFYETAVPDPSLLQIYGYSDAFSYGPGDAVEIRVSTTAGRFCLEIERDGLSPEVVHRAEEIPGQFHAAPENAAITGCGWPVAYTLTLPGDWPSGFYKIHFIAEQDGREQRHEHFFVIRPEGGARRADLVLVHSTATWTAYNAWGGSCHYAGLCGESGLDRSPRLSIQRPFERGFVELPVGAPRVPLGEPPPPMAASHYPNLDYAYSRGLGKFYACASYATYQRPFMLWAEAQGFSLDQMTQHDLHLHPELLDGYKGLILVGHDEYWSAEMRRGVDGFVDSGGHVARFGGNFQWQIRLEEDAATQVCHWGVDDPVEGTDEEPLLTGAWDDPRIGWPGAKTLGLTGNRGIYTRISGASPRASGGFTVYRPEHWAFAGTDLYYGDVFGAAAGIVGYEVDGLDYTFRHGLPEPTGADSPPEGLEILAMAPVTSGADPRPHPGSVYFVSDDDNKAVAETLYGEVTPETIEKTRRGSAMMASFARGRGEVFNAATCEWVAGLIGGDVFTEQITHNVLTRCLERERRGE